MSLWMNLNIFDCVFFLLSFGSGTEYLKIHVARLGEFERESAVSDRDFWSKLSRLFQTTCILHICVSLISGSVSASRLSPCASWGAEAHILNTSALQWKCNWHKTNAVSTYLNQVWQLWKGEKIHPKRLKIRKVRSHQRGDKELKFSSEMKTALGE